MRFAVACAVVSLLPAFPAFAAEGTPKPVAAKAAPAGQTQQDKLRRCNATAKEKSLKGEERKAFMSACLKG